MGSIVQLVKRPESEKQLSEIAEDCLRRVDGVGRLPTPLDELIEASKLVEGDDIESSLQKFLKGFTEDLHEGILSTFQKVRGIADLRERAIYTPAEGNHRRRFFTRAHEFGHQIIPWHTINTTYLDDGISLSPDAQELFDQEANFLAAEIIFQGCRFARRSRDFAPSFESVFKLADDHGASYHATLWRYVEEHDETIAVVPYWPSRYILDADGHPILKRGRMVGSSRFIEKYSSVEIPTDVDTGDPWVACRELGRTCQGEVSLNCDAAAVKFEWHSWWNQYSLFVLLRRRPSLSIVGRIFRAEI